MMSKWTPRHTKEELNAAAVAAQAEGGEATAHLLSMMRPYMVAILRRIDQTYYSPEEREDLDQAALVGVLEALQRFDPEVGVKFSSFAYRHIQHEVSLWLARNSGALPLSKRAWQSARKIENALEEEGLHPHDVHDDALAEVAFTVTEGGEQKTKTVPSAGNIFRARRDALVFDTEHDRPESPSAEDVFLEEDDALQDRETVLVIASLEELPREEWDAVVADHGDRWGWTEEQVVRALEAAALYHGEAT